MTDYPVVPNAPGVPPVARDGSNTPTTPGAVTADGNYTVGNESGPQWGIFTLDLLPYIIGSSVMTVGLMKESRISTYPVEAPTINTGVAGFSSYNKVQTPFTSRISIAQSGDTTQRADFLSKIDAAYQSTDLYAVLMPELYSLNANIVHYALDRNASQANMVVVDIWLEEVRTTATTTLTQTKNPLSGQQQDVGAVQATNPTPGQTASQQMQGAN